MSSKYQLIIMFLELNEMMHFLFREVKRDQKPEMGCNSSFNLLSAKNTFFHAVLFCALFFLNDIQGLSDII